MSKRKTFRRVKVSNRGYVSGKRLQGFRATLKEKKSPASVTSTGGGRGGNIDHVPASYDTTKTEAKQDGNFE